MPLIAQWAQNALIAVKESDIEFNKELEGLVGCFPVCRTCGEYDANHIRASRGKGGPETDICWILFSVGVGRVHIGIDCCWSSVIQCFGTDGRQKEEPFPETKGEPCRVKRLMREDDLVKMFVSYVLPVLVIFLFCCVEIIVCWNFALNHTLAFEFVDLSGENGVFFLVLAMFLSLPLFILHFATTRLFWGWRFFLFAVINGPMSFNYYFWVALIASV